MLINYHGGDKMKQKEQLICGRIEELSKLLHFARKKNVVARAVYTMSSLDHRINTRMLGISCYGVLLKKTNRT